jgi:outer membrane protein OmpA-like peptidoglycan-associated protein
VANWAGCDQQASDVRGKGRPNGRKWASSVFTPASHQRSGTDPVIVIKEDAMRMERGFLLGALGCLAVGISGGEAVAETPSQADIAGQLMPQAQVKTRGLPTLGVATRPEPDAAVTPVSAPAVQPWPRPQEDRYTPSTGSRRSKAPVVAAAAKPPAPPKVGLDTIQFEFGSDRFKQEAIETLRNLGKALNEELKDQKLFLVEGHTDAVGSQAYNAALSDRRAEAVKDYLVREMGVSSDRLKTVGKGSSEPVVSKNPYAAQNRRVVVVNIGA